MIDSRSDRFFSPKKRPYTSEGTNWFSIDNRVLDIESDLAKNGILFLEDRGTDETGGTAFSYVRKEIMRIFKPFDVSNQSLIGTKESPIELYINTEGGPVNEAFALYDDILRLRRLHGLYIEMIVEGFAFSGGALVLQAGWRRYMTPNSLLMIHGLQVEGVGGTIHELDIDVDMIHEMNRNMVKIFAKRMKMDFKILEKRLQREDWYFTPKEALKYNLIDEIIR